MMSVHAEAAVGRSFRRTIEKALAAITLALGLGLTMFSGSFSFDPYAFLAMVAGPGTWAVYLTALGSVRLAFLIVNGYYPHSPLVRAWLSFVTLMTVWSPLAAAFFYNLLAAAAMDPDRAQFYPSAALAPGFIVIEGLCLYALLVLWKAHRDGRRVGEDHRGGGYHGGDDIGGGGRGDRREGHEQEGRHAHA